MLFEIHQPIGHLQVRHVVDRAVRAEGRGIFAVRVDHHDMPLRREVADPMQDQRGGGRLARAGRADEREMLAEHRIDIQRGGNVGGRIDGADRDIRAVLGGIDLAQVARRDREHLAARHGIARHPAAESVQRAGRPVLVPLAKEIDLARDDAAHRRLERERADIGDDP